MVGDYYVHSGVNHLLKGVQQLAEFLLQVCIPLAIPKVFDALFLTLGADLSGAKLLCLVCCINYYSFADVRRCRKLLHDHQQLGPAAGLVHPADIHVVGTSLGVDKHRIREAGRESGFPDSFRAVDYNFLGT